MAHSHIRRMQQLGMYPGAPGSVSDSNSITSGPVSVPGPVYANYISQGSNSFTAGHPASVSSMGYRSMPRPVSTGNMYRAGSRQSLGGRSMSRNSLGGGNTMSRSLRASQASLASIKSGKTTIQQEAHDKQVQRQLRAPWFGPGRKPFTIAMIMFGIALAFIIAGCTLLYLRYFGNLFLSLDKGEIIGPVLLACSLIFIGVGLKFIFDAYRVGNLKRNQTKFRAHNSSMVSIASIGNKPRYKGEQAETLLSGTATKNAITRTPMGSRSSLNVF